MALLVSVLGVSPRARRPPRRPTPARSPGSRPRHPAATPSGSTPLDGRQGVPARGTSAHELLAPLVHEHGLGADATFDGTVPPTPAGRGPPPHDPPSPVELSVLRV